ncbi:MAG: hypothetical protein U0271_45330 [Polyangiaceae bacterium]
MRSSRLAAVAPTFMFFTGLSCSGAQPDKGEHPAPTGTGSATAKPTETVAPPVMGSRFEDRDDPLPIGAVLRLGTRRWLGSADLVTNSGEVWEFGAERTNHPHTVRNVGKNHVVRLPGKPLAFAPDAAFVLVQSAKEVVVIDLATEVESARVALGGSWAQSAVVSADGKVAAVGLSDKSLDIIDLEGTARISRSTKSAAEAGELVAISNDGARALFEHIATDGKALHVLVDVAKGKTLFKQSSESAVLMSPDGEHLFLFETRPGETRVVRMDVGKRTRTDIGTVALDPIRSDFAIVAGGARAWLRDGDKLALIDLEKGSIIRETHGEDLRSWAASPDGEVVALVRRSKRVSLADRPAPVLPQSMAGVNGVALLEQDQVLLTTDGNAYRLWDTETGEQRGAQSIWVKLRLENRSSAFVEVLDEDKGLAWIDGSGKLSRVEYGLQWPIPVALTDDETLYMLGGDLRIEPRVGIYPRGATQPQRTFDVGFRPTYGAVSNGGRWIAFLNESGARAITLPDGTLAGQSKVKAGLSDWRGAVFAGEGALVDWCLYELLIHAVPTLEVEKRMAGQYFAAAATSDGTLLATAHEDYIVVRDLATMSVVGVFQGHAGRILDLQFSHDGRYLVSGSEDTTALVWDLKKLRGLVWSVDKAPTFELPKGVENATAVRWGSVTSCALVGGKVGDDVWCWGKPGTKTEAPKRIEGIADAVELHVAGGYACALTGARDLYCWGTLGSTLSAPSRMLQGVRALDAIDRELCALDATGEAICWRDLGAPGTPVEGIQDASALITGDGVRCFVAKGRVACAGKNSEYQLGDGTGVDRSAFAVVPNLADVVALDHRGRVACALDQQGKVSCWGELDFGDFAASPSPTEIPVLRGASRLELDKGFGLCARVNQKVVCATPHLPDDGSGG